MDDKLRYYILNGKTKLSLLYIKVIDFNLSTHSFRTSNKIENFCYQV